MTRWAFSPESEWLSSRRIRSQGDHLRCDSCRQVYHVDLMITEDDIEIDTQLCMNCFRVILGLSIDKIVKQVIKAMGTKVPKSSINYGNFRRVDLRALVWSSYVNRM